MTAPLPLSDTRRSAFADADAARRAVELVLPMIEPAVALPHVCGSGFLYIVVMDPARTPHDGTFEDAVLHEHAVGDPSRWDADYAAFARAKARLSWLHGADSAALQATRGHLLGAGDTLLWGSVCLDGIVVGVSGAESWYDEVFATAIAGALRGLAKERQAAAVRDRQLFIGTA